MQDGNGRRRCCRSSRRITAKAILSFLLLPVAEALQLPFQPSIPSPIPARSGSQTFTLRHIFHRGTYRNPDLHKRLDVDSSTPIIFSTDTTSSDHDDPSVFSSTNITNTISSPPILTVQSETYTIDRLSDRSWPAISSYLSHSSYFGSPAILDSSYWTRDEIAGPNTTDKETLINLAYMAANAYVPVAHEGEWSNVTGGYNDSTPFGWEGDGLRGHIFASENNETIIIGLKGTSPAVFDGDGTTTRDKLNDNLFFSCCCGQGGQYFWRQVCDCQASTYTCNSTCLVQSLRSKTRYYHASVDLYNNITELYPNSNVWIVGHSLGGAVSSLLGLTFGLPVVTFEAPGDDLAARRLGLPLPANPPRTGSDGPGPDPPNRGQYSGARHFGHTADPVFMGSCNSATATCTLGGYAMESQCHTGLQCVYDTVNDMGWRVGIGYHKIHNVIDDVIRKYKEVPKCITDTECVDCYNWKFFESNGSDSSTTTRSATATSTTSYTRTSTCKTPGWWGCLDPTTSASTTMPVVTTTYTTTSCVTPGWFGCKESANVTVTTTTIPPTASSSSSSNLVTTTTATTTTTSSTRQCTPNFFFGCDDDDNDTSSSSTRKYHYVTATSTATSRICETPGLFFGCHDQKKHFTTRTLTVTTKVRDSNTITPIPSSSSSTEVITSSSPPRTTTTDGREGRKKCKHPALFGLICLDNRDDRETLPALATGRPKQDEASVSEL